jgi:23S rRNA pseudouridine1911/1915/1917 synthase
MSDETILRSRIPVNAEGRALSDYLSSRFRYQDREVWEDLIRLGKVTVNGKVVGPRQPLRKGDLVSYSVILREPPVDRDIRILHEEEAFLVALKPGNLPSHADGNFIKNTFIYLIHERLSGDGWKGKAHLVHRLDRETSGLMVVAKRKEAHRGLVRQFEQGLVEKEYLAVARGDVSGTRFSVDLPIGKDPSSQVSVRYKAVPPGTPFSKPASTGFIKVQDLKGSALLRCVPRTGRTNQIRVHLDHLGHPLVGDKLYGRSDEQFLAFIRHVKSGGDPSTAALDGVARHLLHASKLVFDHPGTGKRLTFEAPLPADMASYIEANRV